MSWSSILDHTVKALGGAGSKTLGLAGDTAALVSAPIGASLDLTRWATGMDLDEGPLKFLSAKKSLAAGADILIGNGSLTGWSVNKVAGGLNWAYFNGIDNPIEALGYHDQGQSWGDAWSAAKQRTLGQDIQLDFNQKINSLSKHTGNWDTSAAVRSIPLVGTMLESAGIGADDTKNIKQTDADAWTEYQKHSPFWSGLLASATDTGLQFALDPGIAAGHAATPLKAANDVRKEGKGFDDLFGTVKYETPKAPKTATVTDDFGDTIAVPAKSEPVVDDFGNHVQVAVEHTPGRIKNMNAAEIYTYLRLDKVPEQGQAIATLYAKANQLKNPADRINALRGITAVTRADVDGIRRLRISGLDDMADTLTNATLGRQSGSIAAAARDSINSAAIRAGSETTAFGSPDVLAEIDRQLGNDSGYLQSLNNILDRNTLRGTSKGERALARLHGQGMGRDGTAHTGYKAIDAGLNRIGTSLGAGKFQSSGSVVDDALDKSTEFARTSPIRGAAVDTDIENVYRGAFATPVTVARKGIKVAGWATVTPFIKAGYGASDALRGRVIHGALNVEEGNEALVAEFVKDRLRRAHTPADEATAALSKVIQAKNPTERFMAVQSADDVAQTALANHYGIGKSAIGELSIRRGILARETQAAKDGQAYSAATKDVINEAGETVKIPADVFTMADDHGAMHISSRAGDEGPRIPLTTSQTPNQIMLPDLDFVDRNLRRDSGKLSALSKLRDNMNADDPLVAQARELGLKTAAPLRAQSAANAWLADAAENSNNMWKRAVLLTRAPSFALRNTLEEEMRVWASGMAGITTQIAFQNMSHRLRENLRTKTSIGAKMFDHERVMAHSVVSQDLETVNAIHSDPQILDEVETVKKNLTKAKAARTRAESAGDTREAEKQDARVDFFQSRPALAEHKAREAQITELTDRLAQLDHELTTKVGIGEGKRTFRGVTLSNAYEGEMGDIFRKLVGQGSLVDNEVNAMAQRHMGVLRGTGEDNILAPHVGSPKDYLDRHLTAWSHALNYHFANDAVGREALLAISRGATPQETGDAVARFLASPAGKAARESNPMRAHDVHAWGQDIADTLHPLVPDTDLAKTLLEEHVSEADLADRFPDVDSRPNVYFTGISSVAGSSARKSEVFAGQAFRKIDQMSLQTFTRHPLFQAKFQQEQERLAGQYIDRLKLEQGEDPEIDIDEINKITHRARRSAEKFVKESFYDTSSRSVAAQKLRYIYPFFAAHQDSMTYWGHAIAQNPEVLRKVEMAFEMPARLGLAVDYNGNPVKPADILNGDTYILMQVPPGWGGPSTKDPKANAARVKLRLSSFNLILQNGSILNPGAGPLAAVPAGYVQRQWGSSDKDISDAMKWFNPYGAPLGDSFSGSIAGSVLPTPVKRLGALYGPWSDEHSHEYNQMYAMYLQEAQVKYFQDNGHAPNDRQARVMANSVGEKVRKMAWMRFGASIASPVQPTVQSRMQGLKDEFKRLQDQGRAQGQGPLWATDKFLDSYGDAYIPLTRSASEYRSNLNPSRATVQVLKENQSFLKTLNPSTWQVVVGNEGKGAFSTDAYRYMQGFKVSSGSTDTLIDERDPQTQAFNVNVAAGYRKYNKLLDNLRAIAVAKGYTTIDQSPELSKLKQQAVAQLSQDYPQWAKSRQAPTTDYAVDILPSLQAIASNKKFVNDPGRPEIKLVADYLKVRQVVTDALKVRAANGGASTLDAKANSDIATVFANYIASLEEGNTVFADYVMPNLIERDPYYKPDLATVTP